MSGTDPSTLAAEVLKAARKKGLMIATAESCTGGLVSAALTEIAGSSDVFERGFVTYSNAAKADLLGVPQELLKRHGAVSAPVAQAMAEGALSRSQADIAVSITGVAGPGASDKKPAGLVYFGLAQTGRVTETRECRFDNLNRAGVRAASVDTALDWLLVSVRRA
ncbi:CinA family protein [Hyphobacterium marinum]|uniref:Nicotinamide-nucleotide amidohydrolase family protein n=1 Tax=Hyphobacterium marinum TaxID=3116574 RepID=A0ABU7LYG6_9PROT|nr:nicotinamide-nucleotide amidohydrolase family protein [Hyphobacterium sp. Y6023]MEE2566583.1 nicotinamide-nucleotide amidohydrolase family protein [Hyphobacterium sp. Y6023]